MRDKTERTLVGLHAYEHEQDPFSDFEGKTMPPPEFKLTANPLLPLDQPFEDSAARQQATGDDATQDLIPGDQTALAEEAEADTEASEATLEAPVVAAPVAPVGQEAPAAPQSTGLEEESEALETEGPAQSGPAADAGAEDNNTPNDGAGTAGEGGDAGAGMGAGLGGGDMTPFEAAPAALDTSDSSGLVQSLASQKPTTMVATMPEVGNQLPAAQQGDKTQAEGYLPEVMQPTGLGSDETEAPAVESELPAQDAPALQLQNDGTEQVVPTEHPKPQAQLPTARVANKGTEALKQPGALRNAINAIPTEDGAVDTSAGPRPQVQLTGEADPQQNVTAQTEADASVSDSKGTADLETRKDFGEKGILPNVTPELMKVQQELAAPDLWNGKGNDGLPEMDAQLATALDAGILAEHQDEIDAELAKEQKAQTEFDTQAQAERDKGLADIAAENEKVKQQQLAERERGESEVQAHRDEWQAENEKVMSEFDASSQKKRAEVEGNIQSKVAETDAKVEKEYAAAEQKAQSETLRAQNKVEAEKAAAKEKENNKSWWDSVCDAVGDFFAALKEAVSAIFDALRAAVSAIIEGAKKLAGALIDMARDAIKGLISAFAEALKAFVKLALAAFPELADKFCKFIDDAVALMHKAIDALAEGLKAAVNALLDLVGAAVNLLLDAYQAYINAILDVLEALTVGFLKVMKGIANLGSAAYESPGHFLGQVSEEMLGSDVTQPLPNEYAAAPETAALEAPVEETATVPGVETITQPAAMMNLTATNESPAADATLLQRERYTETDFDMPVASGEVLDDELQSEIGTMGEGEYELPVEGGEDKGIEALKAEVGADETAAPAQESPQQLPEADSSAPQTEAPATEAATTAPQTQAPAPADPSRDRFTPDANGMVGPFSAFERAKFSAKQMVDGVSKWFSENWGKILLALIAVIGGVILANILTGGAIMAALPIVMQLVSAYFAAETLVNVAKYLGKYLTEAWPGNIGAGAKALARGLAIGAIELLFTLLFGGKAALKAVKSVAKTAVKGGVKGLAKGGLKLAKDGLKATAKNVKDLGKIAMKGAKTAGKNIVKGGKFLLKGVGKGFSKGAKKVKDLAKRLSKWTKFDKIKLSIQKKRWKLMGHMNPWILMADGTIQFEGDMKSELLDPSHRSRSKAFQEKVNAGINDGTLLKAGKEAEEKQLLLDYLNRTPQPTHDPIWALEKHRAGLKLSDDGYFYRQVGDLERVDAKMLKDKQGVDVQHTVKIDELSDGAKKEIQKLQTERLQLLDEVDAIKKKFNGDKKLYEADPDYKSKMNQVNQRSQGIGEIGGKDALEKLNGSLTSHFGGKGSVNQSGVFDEVLETTGGNKTIISAEYKGGSADLGYATVKGDKPGVFVRAEQGSLPHVNYTLESMVKKGGKAKAAAKEIENIGVENCTFAMVMAKFNGDGEVAEILIKYFDLK